jgi:hypothetical protein
MPHTFGIVGIPLRGRGPYDKPAPGSIINPQHPLAQGLSFYCPFNEIGSVNPLDSVARVPIAIQNAARIDPVGLFGGNQYDHLATLAGTAAALAVTDQYSIATKIFVPTSGSNNIKGIYTNGRLQFYRLSDDNIFFLTQSGVHPDYIYEGAQYIVGAGKNIHESIVGTRSGTTTNVYSQGVYKGGATNSTSTPAAAETAQIGGQGWGDTSAWNCWIHYLGIWKRALNPTEIAQLHWSPYQMFWEPGRRAIFVPSGGGGPVTWEEGGTVGVSASVSGAATVDLVGAGSVTGNAGMAGTATVELQGSGSLTVNTGVAGSATVDLAGSGSLTTQTGLAGAATVELQGSGTLTTNTGVSGTATVDLQGSGSVTVSTGLSGAATVDLAGAGTLTVSGTVAGLATVELQGAGTITVNAGLEGEWNAGELIWQEGGTITASSTVAGDATVELVGGGSITVNAGVAGEWDTGVVIHEEGGTITAQTGVAGIALVELQAAGEIDVEAGVAGSWSTPVTTPVSGYLGTYPTFSW